jgi:type I restriction enzyme S subunit
MIKYSNYKPSGVEWIGDIPEHWGKYRLKNISISVNGYSFKSDDFDREYDIPVIRIGDVGDIIDFEDCIKVKSKFLEEKKDFIVKKNDILIGLTGGTIGKSGRYNYESPSLLNQRVGLLRNKKEVLNGLLYHYVKSEVFIRYIFYYCYGGGQDNISMNDILNMVFPLPPSREQLQIVQFLDEKTELIDKLISTKERKITLLKEQRTSLINQVVTKGLNPNVKMKDSGVKWIGDIPEGWMMSKFKFDTKTPVQYGLNISGDKYLEEGIRFIRITDLLEGGGLIPEDGKYLDIKDVPSEFLLNKFDILFCRTGHTVGKSYLHLEDGNYTSGGYLVRFNFGNYFQSKFIFYISKTSFYWDWIKLNSVISTIENVNGDKYQNFQYPKPSKSEQKEIVEFLDTKLVEIDDLVKLEQKKIDLLKEYRQSLISEVITGKIKVTTNE